MYSPSPGIIAIQARADYEDHLRRIGFQPDESISWQWNVLDEKTKAIYLRRAESRLIVELGGPWDEFFYKITAPWALPIFNSIARFFDRLSDKLQKRGGNRG